MFGMASFPPSRYEAYGFTIRAYNPGDGVALAESVQENYEHLRPWMPWAKPLVTSQEQEDLIAIFRKKAELREDFTMGIWQSGRVVGGTGFHLRWGSLEGGIGEIGMWVHHDLCGQGFATRALKAMLDWGFTDWGFRRLVWCCDTLNLGSARVAEKNGLVREGTLRQNAVGVDGSLRDTAIYAILRGEHRLGN